MRLAYAIAVVPDMARSVAFYRDVVGLPLRFESPGWSEFATEGATFALHAGAAGPPGSPGCRPGFNVADLDAFHERVTALGVACLEAPATVFGARVALYRDPDGLPFSVAEQRSRQGA